MRLIDAEQLSESIHENVSALYEDAVFAKEDCLTEVYAAPTVDAVPVVRCLECIAYTPVDDNTGKCVFLIGKHRYVVPDGYCYLGERKEGAD